MSERPDWDRAAECRLGRLHAEMAKSPPVPADGALARKTPHFCTFYYVDRYRNCIECGRENPNPQRAWPEGARE